MAKPNFIAYLKTLKPEDWNKQVTDKWTVKEVVAHMVGWEKDDPEMIKLTWETKELPWFYKTKSYDEFNRQSLEYYKDFSPNQLIEEWEKWQKEVEKFVADRDTKKQANPSSGADAPPSPARGEGNKEDDK